MAKEKVLPSSTGLQSSPSLTHRRDPTRATRKVKKASSHRRYIDTAFETRAASRAATASASLRRAKLHSRGIFLAHHSCEAVRVQKLPREPTPNGAAMGAGSAPRCPTPFAHGPMSPTKGCSSASGTPPRWQTLLNRLSSANPLASPGAVGLFPGNFHPPPGPEGHSAASANVVSDVATSCSHHPHSRLAPASLHRVALEASASIADGRMRHAPVSSPRPERPAARAHLNPMFRTESPKTEVQTAIAMLQAAEEEKERARRRRRDERAAAKEAKRLAGSSRGGARGSAERAAMSRAEILARHGPARTDSLDSLDALRDLSHSSRSGSDASSSDDDAGGSSDSGTSSIGEPTETKSGAHRRGRSRRRRHHHQHRHDTRHAAAKRRKTEEESKKRRRSHDDDDDDASEKHHKSKHHKSGHHKSKHHKSKHHKSKHHKSGHRRKSSGHHHTSGREPEHNRDGDVAADASRARDRVDVNVRTKLDAGAERQERMEAECAGMRRVWSKTGLSETINRSCGNLVALIENAYGSFIAHPGGSSRADATPRPDSPIPA